jgi:hypothetical protein
LDNPVKEEIEEDEDAMEWNAEVNEEMETAELSARPQVKLKVAGVAVPEFVFPKSSYDGHNRPLEISKERAVLKIFFVLLLPFTSQPIAPLIFHRISKIRSKFTAQRRIPSRADAERDIVVMSSTRSSYRPLVFTGQRARVCNLASWPRSISSAPSPPIMITTLMES